MKTKILFLFAICSMQFANLNHSFAQCLPMIKIDGNNIIADENNSSGLKLPTWLKATQTLEKSQNVFSIAVIEFTVNGTALDYSQNLSVTTAQTVPANKVWKIESIHKDPSITPTTNTYNTAGTYTFNPACSGTYRVKVWSGGGGGAGGNGGNCGNNGGGGGGGGGYAEGSYFMFAGSSYIVVVGAAGTAGTYTGNNAGSGGSSSVSIIGVSVTGGAGGDGWCTGLGGSGGIGSGGQINSAGQVGSNGTGTNSGGSGGTGAGSGGVGGTGSQTGTGGTGSAPGGGGGGSGYAWGTSGGPGAAGKVEISLGGTGTTSSRVPCVVLYQYSNGACTSSVPAACPAGWTDSGCGPGSYSGGYVRTCYKCD